MFQQHLFTISGLKKFINGVGLLLEAGVTLKLMSCNICLICVLLLYVVDIRNSYGASNLTMFAALEDLIHLPGPVTEDIVLKTLQARFYAAQYYVS